MDTMTPELTALRDDLMQVAGWTAERTEKLFSLLCRVYGKRPEELPAFVDGLTVRQRGIDRRAVLIWLHDTLGLASTPNGRALISALAHHLDQLSALVDANPSPSEPRH